METMILMRTCRPDGTSYNGFRWPLTVGATVEAPDWDPRPVCGGGLHGLPRGEGDGSLLDWSDDAVWMAVEGDADDVVAFDGKAKTRRVVVRAVGDRRAVTDYVVARCPGAAVVGAVVSGGDGATVSGGDRAVVSGGDRAVVSGGDDAVVSGGADAIVTGGYGATVTGGYHATVTGGYHATVTGGDHATVTGGADATVTGGDGATVTGGDHATVTGGYHATVTGGDHATVTLSWWDGARSRLTVGYIGEGDLLAAVSYRLDRCHRLVRS